MTSEGAWNRRVGWISMAVGVGTGLLMGLWAFDGPMAVPEWLGPYDSVARRLARLGHIAFLGLGILDVLIAREIPRLALSAALRRTASVAMIFGNVLLPPALFAAAAWRSCKFLLPPPAIAVFVALVLTAWGVWGTKDE